MKKPTFCGVSADETPTKFEKQVFAKLFLPSATDRILPSSRESALWWETLRESFGRETDKARITKANFRCKNSQIPVLFC